MSQSTNEHLSEQIMELLNRGRKREQIVNELLSSGHEAYYVKQLVEETYKMRLGKMRQQGLVLILVGAIICLLSCILTMTTSQGTSSMPFVLYGLTSLGVIIVFAGFSKVF